MRSRGGGKRRYKSPAARAAPAHSGPGGAMEEAQRLLTVSVWKLYRCRLQRGGLRLHQSLQLSLLVRAARHRYLSARAAAEQGSTAGNHLGMAPGDPHREDPPRRPSPAPCSPRDREDPESPDPRSTLDREDPASPDPRSNRDREDPASLDPSSTQDLSQDQHRDQPQASPSRYRSQTSSPRPPPPPRDPSSAPCSSPPPEPGSPGAPPVARVGRKRQSSGSTGAGPVLAPSKRSRLEAEKPPLAPGPPGRCSGPPAAAFAFLVRAVGAC
ncbi:immediate early response gene 2 protein [Pezoporus wallicus]|uniref:immediate early response gene 2 protein n=1 Tax=Pezoporus wallicus TaxID=35540 RepID=UPI00254A9117|nr:immediate early response gene 2 protein [Pezoporus wallicus]